MAKNCSILSQKVPKFELYKHNDELFNIYYGIFYQLWTFAYFDRLCKLEKRGDEIKKNSSPLKLLSQSQPNFAEMILGWSPFKLVSVSTVLFPRWPPLLKIEISSNGQKLLYFKPESPNLNCISIMMSFLTYITGFFYVLWTFAYFDRLCKLEKRGDEIKKNSSPLKLLSQSQLNFAEMILGWSPFKIVSVSAVLYAAITKNRNFFKWPKLLYFKPESAQMNCISIMMSF